MAIVYFQGTFVVLRAAKIILKEKFLFKLRMLKKKSSHRKILLNNFLLDHHCLGVCFRLKSGKSLFLHYNQHYRKVINADWIF